MNVRGLSLYELLGTRKKFCSPLMLQAVLTYLSEREP